MGGEPWRQAGRQWSQECAGSAPEPEPGAGPPAAQNQRELADMAAGKDERPGEDPGPFA